MEAPPEAIYSTRDDLLTSVKNFALSEGYVVTIRRSTANKNVILGCDMGGVYHDRVGASNGAQRRRTSTRRIGCPFELCGLRSNDSWKLKVRNPIHTHGPSDLAAHPQARKFTTDQRAEIGRLSSMGIRPQTIEAVLREADMSACFTRRDIYNARMAERLQRLGGRSPVEYLVQQLRNEESWLHAMQTDDMGHIRFLMFAHQKSIDYANHYNRVFLLDCTYKTNRYRMPLLHIVGVSRTNQSFSVAFCFMENEEVESYCWALSTFFSFIKRPNPPSVLCTDRDWALLSAIDDQLPDFPHILCVWHLNKNIQAHCKKEFATNEEYNKFFSLWINLTNAPKEEMYNQSKKDIRLFLQDKPHIFHYLESNVLVHRERFVVAWTRKWLHLGNAATSRVEGAHATMKRWIGSSKADILTVFEMVERSIVAQVNAIDAGLAQDRISTPVFANKDLFTNLIRRVSRYAITRLVEQYQRVKRVTKEAPLLPCTNTFTGTMGLPCSHRMVKILQSQAHIQLAEVHPFWRITDHGTPYR